MPNLSLLLASTTVVLSTTTVSASLFQNQYGISESDEELVFSHEVSKVRFRDDMIYWSKNNLEFSFEISMSRPSARPSFNPSTWVSSSPSVSMSSSIPTDRVSEFPSSDPSVLPSIDISISPSIFPTYNPSNTLSDLPTITVSNQPSLVPSVVRSFVPSAVPSSQPSEEESATPSYTPSGASSILSSAIPSGIPSRLISLPPSIAKELPTLFPSMKPSLLPSGNPTVMKTEMPTNSESQIPSISSSLLPSNLSSLSTSNSPSEVLSGKPSAFSSNYPSNPRTVLPTKFPLETPSHLATEIPTTPPSRKISVPPYSTPSDTPSMDPTDSPSELSLENPSVEPSNQPSPHQTVDPSNQQTSEIPTNFPSEKPTEDSSSNPSNTPSETRSDFPSNGISITPSNQSSNLPTTERSFVPSVEPSTKVSETPSNAPTEKESILPSLPLSDKPSMIPSLSHTEVSSYEPSIAISDKPSYSPTTIVHSTLPSQKRTQAPSDLPSIEPSNPPSRKPTSFPSELPSVDPSLLPTTAVPSSIPSIGPSRISHYPTLNPSTSPFELPTPVPITAKCFVDVDIACIPLGNSASSCASIPLIRTQCADRPFALVFKYNGGNCMQSENIQSPNLFQCMDFGMGPPSSSEEESFIVVRDSLDNMFHESFVTVGDQFTIADEGNNLPLNLNITIYSSEDISPQNMLQTVSFDTSCSAIPTMFLKDRFGASQLIIFINQDQGLVSCSIDVIYTFTIGNIGNLNNVILNDLTSEINAKFVNQTDKIFGSIVEPEKKLVINETGSIDTSVRESYSITSSIVGKSPSGYACSASGLLVFDAGYPLPPSIPTFIPTSPPTSTLVPTPDPEFSSCSLSPIVTCDVMNGPFRECDYLRAPTKMTCIGKNNPSELVFIYTGNPCRGNNTAVGFRCNDRNGGPSSKNNVWLEVRSNGFTIFEEEAKKEEILEVRGSFGQVTDVIVSTFEGNGPGIRLQTMRLRTECQERYDLTLLNTFGALQLVGYTNLENGIQLIRVMIKIMYAVTVTSSIRAVIQRAVSIGAFAGERLLRASPTDDIAEGDIFRLGVERRLLDLTNNTTSYGFTLIVNGTSAPNPDLWCGGVSDYSFRVI